jgi:hypothetical protein
VERGIIDRRIAGTPKRIRSAEDRPAGRRKMLANQSRAALKASTSSNEVPRVGCGEIARVDVTGGGSGEACPRDGARSFARVRDLRAFQP